MAYNKCIHSRCCCKCEYQSKIRCHPCNTNIGKGRMTKILGYACSGMNTQPKVKNNLIFFEHKHLGSCEVFTPRKKKGKK